MLYVIIVKQEYQDYHDYCFALFLLKIDYKYVKLFLNVFKNGEKLQ